MGGAPLDYSTGSTLAGPPPPTDRYQGKNADDHNSTPSIGDVNELRRRAKEAEDVARDAEESRQQVAAQVEELRRVADEAEAEARKHLAGGDGKKKKVGMLGRGKKRDAKEGERLALEAKTKKDTFLQAQSQANDAQALALDTKREADRLRQQAEEAEINAASAASMQHSQPVAPSQQPSNGYPAPAATPAYGTGMGQQPQYGGTSFGGQYNPNVMGSGGVEIPTPSGGEDPYSNPFG
jgi:septal ring factor EnvC (AmiA/AmiB activator)